MRKLWFIIFRFFRIDFKEWFAEHCPVHIPTKRPQSPNRMCDYCEKPLNRIIAIDTGEGFALEWECQEGCGDCESIYGWWPFWFGAWADTEQFKKVGIEVI